MTALPGIVRTVNFEQEGFGKLQDEQTSNIGVALRLHENDRFWATTTGRSGASAEADPVGPAGSLPVRSGARLGRQEVIRTARTNWSQ